LIFNSFISDNELLKTIIQEFGIETEQELESKKDNIDVLINFCLITSVRVAMRCS